MRRKPAEPRDHEPPLPPLLVGDAGAAVHVSAPADLLSPHERDAAALLPDDLRVVIKGAGISQLLLIAAGLLVTLVLGVRWTQGLYRPGEEILLVGGPCAVLALLAYRNLPRRRKEFCLTEGGIVVEVAPLVGRSPRATHVPWTEIEDYTIYVDPEKAHLRVVSVRGYTLTLNDRPPRLSTRELIRRFAEQAERHPRAVPPEPFPDVTGEGRSIVAGCLLLFALVVVNSAVTTFLDPSFAQTMAGGAVVSLIILGVQLWWTLDDPDVALADRDSRRLIARLRRWLRRVLNVRAT